ncbi:hypothetical protein [Haloferula rosea]|uniref:Uncharacterized protein n=1 Tax=Haloferula rosea TaxID=490093 RepID=A0A934RDE3_9BACT|nr:hypothetical protein [Haloferula rosea]MBK1826536.1 hypothetical protein [Haloferula rosea]
MDPEERDESQATEPAGIEIRVIGGGAPQGWVQVEPEEEVVRLENKVTPQVKRTLEDVGPAGPEPERRRRGKKMSNRHLTLAMAGGVGVLILLSVVVAMQNRNDGAPGEAAPYEGVAVERDGEISGLGQLSANTQHYLGKAREKLRRYLAATEVADALPVIRDQGRWVEVLKQRWEPLRMQDAEVDRLQLAFAEAGDRAWFSLNGEDDEGRKVNLIFVPKGDEVELDWAASFGVGDVPFGELDRIEPSSEVVMRVVVEADHYYTSSIDDDRYRCFKLTPQFDEDWVWGYAEIGSPVAAQLETVLREDSMILEDRKDVSLILRLRKTPETGRRQLIIEDVVAENWVQWDGER